MKKITGIIIGVLLICCGIIYLLDVFELARVGFSLDGWWTLFIILPCLDGIFTSKQKLGSLVGLLLGVLLLLAARGILEYAVIWKIMVPAVIVVIGIKILVRSVSARGNAGEESVGGVCTEHMAVFNEQVVDIANSEIFVSKIGAVFGGIKCNLADAKIREGSCMNLICIFGGADIVLPENVSVKNNVFCLFGGVSDKRAPKVSNDESPTLTINGFCIFGGADLK